jgi:hypothetical protein
MQGRKTPFIKADNGLFFIGKLPISAKNGHLFGFGSGKMGVCGDKTETLCHPKIGIFFTF